MRFISGFSWGVVVGGVKAAWLDIASLYSLGGLGQPCSFFQFLGPGALFSTSLHVCHQFAPCTTGLRSLCGSSTMPLGS